MNKFEELDKQMDVALDALAQVCLLATDVGADPMSTLLQKTTAKQVYKNAKKAIGDMDAEFIDIMQRNRPNLVVENMFDV